MNTPILRQVEKSVDPSSSKPRGDRPQEVRAISSVKSINSAGSSARNRSKPEPTATGLFDRIAEVKDLEGAEQGRLISDLLVLAHDVLDRVEQEVFIRDLAKASNFSERKIERLFKESFKNSKRGQEQSQRKSSEGVKALREDAPQSEFADHLVKRFQRVLKYDARQKDILRYGIKQPGVFSVQDEMMFMADAQGEASEVLPKGYTYNYLSGACKLALVDGRIIEEDCRQDPKKLGFSGRAIHLTDSGVVELEHSPSNGLRWALDRDYDPSHTQWEPIAEFIVKALPNPSDQDVLICFHAATLRGTHQKMGSGERNILIQRGNSGTGKSTGTNLLSSVIGGNNTLTIESLSHLEENQFALEGLEDYPRVIILPDQSALHPRAKVDRILALTGGDSVDVPRKHRKSAKFVFDGVMVINTTETIFSQYHLSRGIERRSIYISGWRKDDSLKGIEDRFTPEVLSAYTNFLLSLPESFIVETLRNAPSSPNLKEQSRDDSVVRHFASSIRVTGDPSDSVQQGRSKEDSTQLYGHYYQECQRLGTPPAFIKTFVNFGEEVERIINEGKKLWGWKVSIGYPNNKKTFYGIVLKQYSDDSVLPDVDVKEGYTSVVQEALRQQYEHQPEPDPEPGFEPEPEPEKKKYQYEPRGWIGLEVTEEDRELGRQARARRQSNHQEQPKSSDQVIEVGSIVEDIETECKGVVRDIEDNQFVTIDFNLDGENIRACKAMNQIRLVTGSTAERQGLPHTDHDRVSETKKGLKVGDLVSYFGTSSAIQNCFNNGPLPIAHIDTLGNCLNVRCRLKNGGFTDSIPPGLLRLHQSSTDRNQGGTQSSLLD